MRVVTRGDLLNPEQRFQGATAVAISDDEAARLIREYFPKLQASELKYHALARRPGYRRPLMDLQHAVLIITSADNATWHLNFGTSKLATLALNSPQFGIYDFKIISS